MGNHSTRALAAQQRALRDAMDAAGWPMPRETAVQVVAHLHGAGWSIAPFTPETIAAFRAAMWTDQRSQERGGT